MIKLSIHGATLLDRDLCVHCINSHSMVDSNNNEERFCTDNGNRFRLNKRVSSCNRFEETNKERRFIDAENAWIMQTGPNGFPVLLNPLQENLGYDLRQETIDKLEKERWSGEINERNG